MHAGFTFDRFRFRVGSLGRLLVQSTSPGLVGLRQQLPATARVEQRFADLGQFQHGGELPDADQPLQLRRKPAPGGASASQRFLAVGLASQALT